MSSRVRLGIALSMLAVVTACVAVVALQFGVSTALAAPSGASSFRGVSPVRLLDTRQTSKRVAGTSTSVQVAGVGGVPSGASAVVLNVTVAEAQAPGYATVYPWGEPLPNTSNLNVQSADDVVPNLVTVRVGSSGSVGVFVSMSAHVIVDVFGYYQSDQSARAGRFIATVPTRLVDTRGGGIATSSTVVNLPFPVGVPADTEGLVLNVTAVNSLGGYWTAYAAGTPRPSTSNLNMSRFGQTIANQVVVKPSSSGVDFYSSNGGNLIVDLMGYYTGSSASSSDVGLFVPTAPSRLLDTRTSPNPLGVGVALHDDWTVEVSTSDIPGTGSWGVGAVVLNVTEVGTHGAGYLTVYPAGTTRPNASNLNSDRVGLTAPNHVQVMAATRGVAFYSDGGTDLVVDTFGWFVGNAVASMYAAPANQLPDSVSFPGSIEIPKIGLKSKVTQSTLLVNIDPSHLAESRSPNQPGNVAIFGHRVSHGHEFKYLDRLGPGDVVHVTVEGIRYSYRVTSTDIRTPTDPLLYASTSNDQTLSLVACHPPGSVKFRIVVHATLFAVNPA